MYLYSEREKTIAKTETMNNCKSFVIDRKIPREMRKKCINYKKWKRKTIDYSDYFLKKIQKEAQQVEQTYHQRLFMLRLYDGNCERYGNFDRYKYSSNHPSFHLKYDQNAKGLYYFILHNRKSLWKTCMWVDKKAHLNGLFQFWYEYVAKREFTFLKNNHDFTFLKYMKNDKIDSCPICLEKNPDEFIIMKCGHTMCMECLHNFTNNTLKECEYVVSKGKGKGTRDLLIDYQGALSQGNQDNQKVSCPLCRNKQIFDIFYFCKNLK